MASEAITARAAGTWTLGDLTVGRIGNPDHLEDNVAAGALRLSAEDMLRLS